MRPEPPKLLSYSTPSTPGGSIQVERFPDGGVTITIPSRELPPPANTAISATLLALGIGVVVLAARFSPAHIIFAAIVPLAICVGVIFERLVKIGPEVVGMSPHSVYIRSHDGRRFEKPLASLNSIEAVNAEDRRNRKPDCVQLKFATRSGFCECAVCHRRPAEEISMVVKTLKESWNCLRAAHFAPIRDAITIFINQYRESPSAGDPDMFKRLLANGVDRALAAHLLLMAPMAAVRLIHKNAASFHSYYLIVDRSQKPSRRLYLHEDEVFEQVTDIFGKLHAEGSSADLLKSIAGRAAEEAVIKATRLAGKADIPSVPPARIPYNWSELIAGD